MSPEVAPTSPLPEMALSSPPSRWQILRGCRLGGAPIPVVLMHPRHGVVLVGGPPDGPALLRRRLEQVHFPAVFHGHLPVIQLGSPGCPMEPAFAAQPPLNMPGGDAWMSAVERALTRDPPPPPPTPERLGIRARQRRNRGRLMLAGGTVALAFGSLALAIALLPPAPGPQLAEASPVASWEVAMEAVMPLVSLPARLPAQPPLPAAPLAIPQPSLAAAPPQPQAIPPLPPDVPAPPPPALAMVPPRVEQAVVAPAAAPPPGRAAAYAALSGAPSGMPAPATSAPPPQGRAQLIHTGAAAEPSGGVVRCRRILQRLQIGEAVPNGDFRFLQSGCPT